MNGLLWLSHVYWLCLTYQQQLPYITLIVTKISRQENKFLLTSSKKSYNKKNKKKLGRLTNVKKHNAFLDAVQYMEKSADETITVDELHHIMKLKTCKDDVYTKVQLKRQLIDHYGDKVSITSIRQQANIVTLTSKIKNVIHEAHTKAANVDQSSMDH